MMMLQGHVLSARQILSFDNVVDGTERENHHLCRE